MKNTKQTWFSVIQHHREYLLQVWEEIDKLMRERIKVHDQYKLGRWKEYIESRNKNNYSWKTLPLKEHSFQRHHLLHQELEDLNILDLLENVIDVKAAAFKKQGLQNPGTRWMNEVSRDFDIDITKYKQLTDVINRSFNLIELKEIKK